MFKIHGTGTCFVCFVRKKFKKWTGQNCTDPNDKVILNVRYCTVLFEFDRPWLLSICYCYNNDEMLGVPDLRNFYPDLKFFHLSNLFCMALVRYRYRFLYFIPGLIPAQFCGSGSGSTLITGSGFELLLLAQENGF